MYWKNFEKHFFFTESFSKLLFAHTILRAIWMKFAPKNLIKSSISQYLAKIAHVGFSDFYSHRRQHGIFYTKQQFYVVHHFQEVFSMKKQTITAVATLIFIAIATISCSSQISDSKGDEKELSVSNVLFNSVSRSLTADITAEDGAEVTLECNGKTEKAIVADKKIEVVLVEPFHDGIKGGSTYDVNISSEGYNGTQTEIAYWPKEELRLSCTDEQNVFIGGAKNFIQPEFMLKNYDESKVTTKIWFKIFLTKGYETKETRTEITSTDTSTWNFSDMMDFLSDSNNIGKTIEVHFQITPNAPKDAENLASSGYVVLNCKKDVLANCANIVNNYGKFEVRLFAEEPSTLTTDIETAGGIVDYQWQISDNTEYTDEPHFTDIPGANGKSFSLTKENEATVLGKTLRVKISQTFEGNTHEIISETYPVLHCVKTAELYYDDILSKGQKFDTTKIKGTLTDELGNTYSASDFDWAEISELSEKNEYTAGEAKDFLLNSSKNNFYDSVQSVFANVQFSLTEAELPQLSTETSSIEIGKVEFTTINKNLEISFNGGATYRDFPESEFASKTGEKLYIRKRANGTPGCAGYVRESKPLVITVAEENIGKKAKGHSVIQELEAIGLTLKKTNKDGITTITPVLSFTEDIYEYEYTWLIDNNAALSWNGVTTNDNNELIIDTSKFGKDAYQIFCKVRVYIQGTQDHIDIISASAQTSLVVQ